MACCCRPFACVLCTQTIIDLQYFENGKQMKIDVQMALHKGPQRMDLHGRIPLPWRTIEKQKCIEMPPNLDMMQGEVQLDCHLSVVAGRKLSMTILGKRFREQPAKSELFKDWALVKVTGHVLQLSSALRTSHWQTTPTGTQGIWAPARSPSTREKY